jgi:Carboxypeptidase regulatory-like domain
MALRISLLRIVLVTAVPFSASGCFCLSTAQPCQVNMTAEVVFVGRVETVKQIPPLAQDPVPARQVHIVVLEPFRGIEHREVDLVTSMSDCGVKFERNKEYLIYAWRDKESGRLETGACSQTAVAERSQENIQNLREIATGKGPARVFGFATAAPSDLQLPFRASMPLAGVAVTLRSGDQSWRVLTDEKGNYEIRSLPAGDYQMFANLAGPPNDQRNFQLRGGECLRQTVLGVAVGKIAGTLLDSQGTPVPNVLVEIEGVPSTSTPKPFLRPLTDTNGHFESDNISAGEYVLGVNFETPPYAHDWYDKRSPLPRSYYPGVLRRTDASIVKVQAGQDATDLQFRLPPSPAHLTVKGTVAGSDGSLVEALVSLIDLEYDREHAQVDTVQAAPDGRFSIEAIEGRPYAVFAQLNRDGRIQHTGLIEISGKATEGLHLVLTANDAEDACEVCNRYRLGQSPLWKK